jgi:electron transport complex protein RnfG
VSKLRYFVEQSWLLVAAAFVFGLLLAATNAAWAPRIRQNRIDKLNRMMKSLLPQAEQFELDRLLSIRSGKAKARTSELYRVLDGQGRLAGWAFNARGPGFADRIELVVAVDADFSTIAGFDCLASNETPGFGDRIKNDFYRDQFEGAPVETLSLVKSGDPEVIDSKIVAITGATVSSEAVVEILNNALSQVRRQVTKKGASEDDI